MQTIKRSIGMLSIILFVVGCTTNIAQYSPDQVINNALEGRDSPTSYYAELEWIMTENGTEVERLYMKEWHGENGKTRVEISDKEGKEHTIAVNNGEHLLTYQVEENQAYYIDDPALMELNQPSQREQANHFLEMIRDTHDVSVAGEETVIKRETHHLVAEVKEAGGLFDHMELWVDKENWHVLKMSFQAGDMQDEIVYTKMDVKATIPAETFTLDLPEDVEVQNLVDLSMPTAISLDEVTESMGKKVLYFPEEHGLEIAAIEKIDVAFKQSWNEVSFDYLLDDLPLFTLSIYEPREEEVTLAPGDEEAHIRGVKGYYSDLASIRTVNWREDELEYSIIIIDPNVTVEAVNELADTMILTD